MRRISEKFLRKKLAVIDKRYDFDIHLNKGSVLEPVSNGGICDHDAGYLCECRLNWLMTLLRNEDLILDDT